MLYLINEDTLTDIADAIRDKLSSNEKINPSDMPELIASIRSGKGGINGSCVDNDMAVYKVGVLMGVSDSGTTATGTVVEG